MMKRIPELQTFNRDALLHLLKRCADYLSSSYQELGEKQLFLTSVEAYRACEYLKYDIQKDIGDRVLH